MARRRRDGRRESNKYQAFVISPSVIFLRKMTAPSSEGACVRQPQRLSIRFNVFFNLITPNERHISENFLGDSKPPSYRVGYIFSIRAKHLLLFVFHSSLFTFLCPKGLVPPPYREKYTKNTLPIS